MITRQHGVRAGAAALLMFLAWGTAAGQVRLGRPGDRSVHDLARVIQPDDARTMERLRRACGLRVGCRAQGRGPRHRRGTGPERAPHLRGHRVRGRGLPPRRARRRSPRPVRPAAHAGGRFLGRADAVERGARGGLRRGVPRHPRGRAGADPGAAGQGETQPAEDPRVDPLPDRDGLPVLPPSNAVHAAAVLRHGPGWARRRRGGGFGGFGGGGFGGGGAGRGF